jgi:hypothetical protein
MKWFVNKSAAMIFLEVNPVIASACGSSESVLLELIATS